MNNMGLDLYNSICIYTDASTTNDHTFFRDQITSSPGYVIVYNNQIILYGNKFVYRTNSTYGEMYAILMGIKAVYREIISGRLPRDVPIKLFSDSLSSIQNLKYNTKKWYISNDNIIRKTYDDSKVVGQEIIQKIILLVLKYGIPIDLYHIKGHANIKLNKKTNRADKIELRRIKESFYRNNGKEITNGEAAELCYYNIFVDNFTRDNMRENMKSYIYNNNNYKKPDLSNDVQLTKGDLVLFNKYINGGKYEEYDY